MEKRSANFRDVYMNTKQSDAQVSSRRTVVLFGYATVLHVVLKIKMHTDEVVWPVFNLQNQINPSEFLV